VGLSAVLGAVLAGANPIVAVDVQEAKLETALSFGATHAVQAAAAPAETAARITAAAGGGVDYAFEATGRPEAMQAAFLATGPRGAAVLMGISRPDAALPLPPLEITRAERRVLGSVYGSSRPERDFPDLLALYRQGRLPLDLLVSHRLPLEGIEEAFGLMRAGRAARVVLDVTPDRG
jgi:Zn-dependent alcohol dehydrogenase